MSSLFQLESQVSRLKIAINDLCEECPDDPEMSEFLDSITAAEVKGIAILTALQWTPAMVEIVVSPRPLTRKQHLIACEYATVVRRFRQIEHCGKVKA